MALLPLETKGVCPAPGRTERVGQGHHSSEALVLVVLSRGGRTRTEGPDHPKHRDIFQSEV